MLGFFKYFSERRERRRLAERKRGYEYAVDALKKEYTPQKLEMFVYGSDDPFDLGVKDYLRELSYENSLLAYEESHKINIGIYA